MLYIDCTCAHCNLLNRANTSILSDYKNPEDLFESESANYGTLLAVLAPSFGLDKL